MDIKNLQDAIIAFVAGALGGSVTAYFISVKVAVKQKTSGSNSSNIVGSGNVVSSDNSRPINR